jgi:hypothetical protein
LYFHDIEFTCSTNQAAILELLDAVPHTFARPEHRRGEAYLVIICHEDTAHFAEQIPANRRHTETIRLITGTKLRYYIGCDDSSEYLAYAEEAGMNSEALSILHHEEHFALTWLGPLDQYNPFFLRRCVFTLVIGQLMRVFLYEPCHAATVTAPWDDRQGALIFGESGSGKTTLSLGCALSGFGLLGDDILMLREAAPVDSPCGDIHAFALLSEVSVRTGTLDIWPQLAFLKTFPQDFRGKRHCAIEDIRPGLFRQSVAIRLLLFPTLVDSGQSYAIRLSKAQALAEMVERCMRIEKTYPQSQSRLFSLLGQLAEQAPGYRLMLVRDTHDGPRLLSELFARGTHG